MSEHEFEAVRGLPGDLPKGENVLWQGAPDWLKLGFDAFKLGWLVGYFTLLAAWRLGEAVMAGQSFGGALGQAMSVLPLALVALAIVSGLAWINARSTVYTITDKRIVMRFGAALTKAINIPYTIIESASADVQANGAGTVAVKLTPANKIPLLLLWPHRRPRTFANPEPAFRSIKDANVCAPILSEALRVAHSQAQAHVDALEPVSTSEANFSQTALA